MHGELSEFFERPNRDTYLVAREATAIYEFDSSDILRPNRWTELLAKGRYRELLEEIDQQMPRWSLSLVAHHLAAVASAQVGNRDDEELEWFMYQGCVEGILDTGLGTHDQPYIVSCPGDATEIARFLGRTCRKRRLVQCGEVVLDCLEPVRGKTLWCDVSALISRGSTLPSTVVPGRR